MNLSALLKVFGVVTLLSVSLLLPTSALADGYSPLDLPDRGSGPNGVQGESTSSATPSPSPTSTDSESQEDFSSGTVRGVEDNKLIVEVDGEEREIELPEDVQVVRDGQEVSLSDVVDGDTVSFERDNEGEITEVRVASEQSMNFWRGFLPILVVVLVGFYLLSRRTKKAA